MCLIKSDQNICQRLFLVEHNPAGAGGLQVAGFICLAGSSKAQYTQLPDFLTIRLDEGIISIIATVNQTYIFRRGITIDDKAGFTAFYFHHCFIQGHRF